MKSKSSKTSHQDNSKAYPVQVSGLSRTCPCGTVVRRGIMWEFQSTLHCSRRCAAEAETNALAEMTAEQ